MISHQFKCVFVHVPKTAGQSIEQFFLNLHQLSKQEKAQFLADFDQQITEQETGSQFVEVLNQPNKYKTYGLKLLDRYFSQGIIPDNHPYQTKEIDFELWLK